MVLQMTEAPVGWEKQRLSSVLGGGSQAHSESVQKWNEGVVVLGVADPELQQDC